MVKSLAGEPEQDSAHDSEANKTLVGEVMICMLPFKSHLKSKQDAHSLGSSCEDQTEAGAN